MMVLVVSGRFTTQRNFNHTGSKCRPASKVRASKQRGEKLRHAQKSNRDYSHPGVDRIRSLNEPEYISYITHILSTIGACTQPF